ncbi:MAG: 30S ribosomal protein S3 [Chloroflexi bacterium]|nr:MAG: 30S ribosomal protein S3 [Chloroflexota bacterium]
MGHKVHPNAFRLGVFRPWEANWFASPKDYTNMLHEDLEMRRIILARLRIVIGKGGSSVDQLREDLEKRFGNRVRISIQEIKQPELDAQLVAENIASQIERRISYKRAMKQAILRTMRSGAKGVRIYCGGRLRGAEMARREQDREGRVPLHTLRADIDFGRATAKTTFGAIGCKVWIYKQEISPAQRRLTPIPEEPTPVAEPVTPQAEIIEATPEPAAAQVEVPTPEAAASVAPRRTRTATAKVEEKVAAPARPKAAPKPKAEAKTEVKKTAVRTKSTPAAVRKTGTTRNTKKADS